MQHSPAAFGRPRPRARAPGGWVIAEPTAEQLDAPIDWSRWYLTDEEDMGQAHEHGAAVLQFLSSLHELARTRGWTGVLIGFDEFFAWVREHPLVRVSPDVHLLDDPPPPPRPKMWQTWLPGHRPPRFALEIVSDDWKKDYADNPPKYAQLGCKELVIFDPDSMLKETGSEERVALQVYRRQEDGAFVRVYQGSGPARAEEIDGWVVARMENGAPRLRIAMDALGREIAPTEGEAGERERKGREAAEDEVARLRAEIAAMRGQGGG